MERTLLLLAITLPLMASLAIPQSDECHFDESAAKEAAKAVADLSVRLYKEIAKPDANVIFSPVSIALALALVESGAAGETARQIQAVLKPSASNQSDTSQLYQSLQHQLQLQGEKFKLSIANGFFYSDQLHLKKDYVDSMQRCFETEISQQPFAQQAEEARARINDWVSNATAQKIPELFKSGSMDASTMAVLANAIYMKAPWEHSFKHTEQLSFYRSGKEDKAQKVQFMVQTKDYGYVSTEDFEAVELAYEMAPLSMFIVLPKQRDGLGSVEQALTGEKLISLFVNSSSRKVALKLPKFTMRQSVDLGVILKNLGMKDMFSEQADFSRMAAEPLKVSNAVHEAYIKVNENGTEAAAATGFSFVMMAMPMPSEDPIPFVADHPFLYAIVHKPTSAIAFMGRVNSVEE